MSEENNTTDDKPKLEKFEEYYNLAISQLQELVDNFEKEYDENNNIEAKTYAEDIKKCIAEIKETTEKEDMSLEKQHIFADYVEELIEKYTNFYLTILSIQALQQFAELNPAEYEKMPIWEEIKNSNELNKYDPINNMEYAHYENFNENDLNNPEMLAIYNNFLNTLSKQNEKKDEENKKPNENEAEKN